MSYYRGGRARGGGRRGGGHYRGGGGRGRRPDSGFRSDGPAPASSSGVNDANALAELLVNLEGVSYKAYHDIKGRWTFPDYTFIVDRVQSDPFAPPSSCRIQMPASVARFADWATTTKQQRIATGDYLTRTFYRTARSGRHDEDAGGDGWHGSKGGAISIASPTQYVLERTSCLVGENGDVEVRFTVSLPARGRSIEGYRCRDVLTKNLPKIVQAAIPFDSQDRGLLRKHVNCFEDQEALRGQLDRNGLVAFAANGAVLPRASGVSDCPMDASKAVAFQSPSSMEVHFDLPYAGRVAGMGIRKGVTVIVGGGFNGKSTLLQALQYGVYNKIPGDGREFVVADPTAVSIRSEDGRSVACVNIQPFIDNLPFGQDTSVFSTPDASGSTSQAANIVEALESGTRCLLIDEDTSATNFMIRDAKMQELVAAEKEPITPFISKVSSLHVDHGVSTILVMGGSGDYFQAADVVVMMDSYRPVDVTAEAKKIAAKHAKEALPATSFDLKPSRRIPVGDSLDASQGWKEKVTRVKGKTQFGFQVQFGKEEIDLSYVEQLVEYCQTKSIGEAIVYMRNRYMNGKRTLGDCLKQLQEDLDRHGIAMLVADNPIGDLSRARIQEISAAVCRFRPLRIRST